MGLLEPAGVSRSGERREQRQRVENPGGPVSASSRSGPNHRLRCSDRRGFSKSGNNGTYWMVSVLMREARMYVEGALATDGDKNVP